MQFQNVSIALLAAMLLVVAFTVGWLYWQLTRVQQSVNNLALVIAEHLQPLYQDNVHLEEEKPAEEDDRQPVEDEEPPKEAAPKAEIVEGPPPMDTDELEGKTKQELQDLLTKKGIPFSKSDNKNTLITLLKATA
jgi:hypothetical protein